MTKHDFFVLMLKAIGFYALCYFFLMNFPFIFSMSAENWHFIAIQFAVILVYLGIIMSASRIVKLLALEKGIETSFISFKNMNGSTLLQIGLIVVGAYLVVNNIAEILVNGLTFIADKTRNKIASGDFSDYDTTPQLMQSIVKTILGLLVLTQARRLSNLLYSQES